MRIASLLPAATDTVVALGLAERLVAVTFECSVTGCPVVVDTVLPPDLAPEDLPLDVARIGRLNAVRIDGASGVGSETTGSGCPATNKACTPSG